MPINPTFSLRKEESIKAGIHQFVINDLNVKTTQTEKGDVSYITFNITNLENQQQYENLLSAPVSLKKGKYFENSRLSLMLTRFGIMKTTNEFLSYAELNGLIGTKFDGLVIYEDGFAKIDEKSIVVHKK
jgi:hypothetical protein